MRGLQASIHENLDPEIERGENAVNGRICSYSSRWPRVLSPHQDIANCEDVLSAVVGHV